MVFKTCLGVGTSGSRRDIRKGYKRVNMVKILCADVKKEKMRPVETIP
jgi:hypothetical protein